jgi:hypothetical protein
MREILEECLKEFQHIQSSFKGSIGSINNVYLPQLDKKRIDVLVTKIIDNLQQEDSADCGQYSWRLRHRPTWKYCPDCGQRLNR